MSNHSDTNSPVKEAFWRFSRKSPGIAKPVNNIHPTRFEKFNGNMIPNRKKDYDSSVIFNHGQFSSSTSPYLSTVNSQTQITTTNIDSNNNNNNQTTTNSTTTTTTTTTTSKMTTSSSASNLNTLENNLSHLSLSTSSINTSVIGHSNSSTHLSASNSNSLSSSLNSSNGGIDTSTSSQHQQQQQQQQQQNNIQNNIQNINSNRIKKFEKLLNTGIHVDMESLKTLGWRGIPDRYRPMSWKILLGYLPSNCERRDEHLERKRKEYRDGLPQYYTSDEKRGESDRRTLKQIQMDVPRTNPGVPFFQQPLIQDILERILYLWGIRHPSTGYVQGINDLATPFIWVFLSEYIEDVANCQVDQIDSNILAMVEADSYWCLTKLLDGIQDHYTFAQPGIQRMLASLKGLLEKINNSLCAHLADQDAQFITFAFRWMNCLLMREIPFPLVIRMWDTYLSEKEGFSVFHVYVCAAFLVLWSDELKQRDFPDIMIFLQKPPTQNWEERDIESLFSTAFYYRSLYEEAQSHLKSNNINLNNNIIKK
ncbi:hypothetical protein ACTFIZ_008247 [Dictyostelium cf. discoideum]